MSNVLIGRRPTDFPIIDGARPVVSQPPSQERKISFQDSLKRALGHLDDEQLTSLGGKRIILLDDNQKNGNYSVADLIRSVIGVSPPRITSSIPLESVQLGAQDVIQDRHRDAIVLT
ncbi:MAG: hypothetical protein LBT86_10220 [Deltaproteobacteria bacterium]|nr:hypothetical protein [Deltaproteobacteria bacterium]